ncbi:hypothetical protein RRG08_036384 [Elysia crispata]|uniref:Uncharacterized protein n=1 Tax=Elysia crispata TaxID=231223 RepID=A0AAE0ZKF2_9GAST|nr:hypothetical protein RRG08_036384 [Elysia crispata]
MACGAYYVKRKWPGFKGFVEDLIGDLTQDSKTKRAPSLLLQPRHGNQLHPMSQRHDKLLQDLYANKDPLPRNCHHPKRKSDDGQTYLCQTISQDDIAFFNSLCYQKHDKKAQDNFIGLYIETKKKARE